MPRSYHVLLALLAQAVFLLERGQTDRQTHRQTVRQTRTPYPTPAWVIIINKLTM